jgi:hypothetical protein
MEMKMYVTGEDEGDDTMEVEGSPQGIVVESLLNVRTIASLTMEEKKLEEYSDALHKEDLHPMRNNCIKGSGSGLGQFFQFWGMGLMVRSIYSRAYFVMAKGFLTFLGLDTVSVSDCAVLVRGLASE